MMTYGYTLGLSYNDILLKPKKCIVGSRQDVDLSTKFSRNISLDIPIVSAAMDSVTELRMAWSMGGVGGIGIVHRYQSIPDQVDQVDLSPYKIAAAVGVKDDYLERVDGLLSVNCEAIFVDVAHAHADHVYRAIHDIYKLTKGKADLVVGAIATGQAARELSEFPIDGLHVGIGPGSVCTTRSVTGFGVPMVTSLQEVRANTSLPILANGGIETSADIVKALACGANTVIIGKLLARCKESPGWEEWTDYPDGSKVWHKKYIGMSRGILPEGTINYMRVTSPRSSVIDVVTDLCNGVRSGISYGGGRDIETLKRNAEIIQITNAGQIESGVRL